MGNSSPAIALKATSDRTNKRFDTYGKSGLLCGTDGLPHLISEPGLALKYGHAGEILLPTFCFLYLSAILGHTGRQYLRSTNDIRQEIFIDVPLAVNTFGKSLIWPLLVLSELRNGTLLQDGSDITVSR